MGARNPQKRGKGFFPKSAQGRLRITSPHRGETAQSIENTNLFAMFRLLFQAKYDIIYAWK